VNSKLITSMLGITLTTSAMAVVHNDEEITLTKQEFVEMVKEICERSNYNTEDVEISALVELERRGVLIIDIGKSSATCGGGGGF